VPLKYCESCENQANEESADDISEQNVFQGQIKYGCSLDSENFRIENVHKQRW